VSFTGGANRFTSSGSCRPGLSNFNNWVFTARLFGNTAETRTLTSTLPSGTTAVGFDVGVSDETAPSGVVEITLVTGDGKEQTFNVTAPIPGTGAARRSQPVFVGYTSSRPVTAVRFRIRDIADANIVLDNLTMAQTAPPAVVTTNGVVNGGSFRAPIAPNSWISIFGNLLSGSQRIWLGSDFSGTRLPEQIDDVSVTINGRPTYVYFVSPGQLNVLTPPDLPEGPATIVVSRGDLRSQPVTVQVQRAAPGLFMFDAENRRYVAASRPDGTIIGKPALYPGLTTAARPGEVISLWGTGFGRTNPPTPVGEVLPAPLQLLATPVVRIGGATAEVLWAGISAPGLYQFNVRVPQDLPDGDASVTIEVEGAITQNNAFLTIGR
jgi:uncharacterized protein (TIGR03437 family)